jgi:cytochrome c oxidase assembly protein subunit 15
MDGLSRSRYQAGMVATSPPQPVSALRSRRAVGLWLLVVALMIAAMVVIGGLTRLTGSGLSITEWDPIMGAIPPLSTADWLDAFHKYQHIPQYIREHRGMTLAEFQFIYWWEWTHRLLGRLIGAVFLLPFLWFAWTGAIGRREIPRMIVLFALGALQGFVGWWMVESGLETRVSVSQYRLAIHLGVALLLFAAILWTAFEYLRTNSPPLEKGRSARVRAPGGDHSPLHRHDPSPNRFAIRPSLFKGGYLAFIFPILVYLQMLLGALVAGLHAGLIYNTWPSMDGRVFPEHPFFSAPWWINFFENPGLAQFDHRIGAYIVAFAAILVWWSAMRARITCLARTSAWAILILTFVQIALGIATLLNQAPILLSALHQLTALALLSAALWHAFELRRTQSRLSSPASARAFTLAREEGDPGLNTSLLLRMVAQRCASHPKSRLLDVLGPFPSLVPQAAFARPGMTDGVYAASA